MRSKITKIFLFVVINLMLVYTHIEAFQSSVPWLSWATIAMHVYLLMWVIVIVFFNNKYKK